MSVDFLDLLPEHRTILEQALACYVPDDRVAGVMLYGSLAIGQGDEFSDVDLNILAVPRHRDVYKRQNQALPVRSGRQRWAPETWPSRSKLRWR